MGDASEKWVVRAFDGRSDRGFSGWCYAGRGVPTGLKARDITINLIEAFTTDFLDAACTAEAYNNDEWLIDGWAPVRLKDAEYDVILEAID